MSDSRHRASGPTAFIASLRRSRTRSRTDVRTAAAGRAASRRAARQEQRQQGEPGEIHGLGEIAVPRRVGVARQLPPPEVHQQEGEIVEDVAAGDLVVELDPVEHRWLSFEEHDIAQMKIAVALPHES